MVSGIALQVKGKVKVKVGAGLNKVKVERGTANEKKTLSPAPAFCLQVAKPPAACVPVCARRVQLPKISRPRGD
jgi:hypothetical protein